MKLSLYFLVLVTGGRTFGSFDNGELRCYNDVEIIGSDIPFGQHPKIWGHSLVLTNDYRILFCGGIVTSPYIYDVGNVDLNAYLNIPVSKGFISWDYEHWHILQSHISVRIIFL